MPQIDQNIDRKHIHFSPETNFLLPSVLNTDDTQTEKNKLSFKKIIFLVAGKFSKYDKHKKMRIFS